MAKNKSLKPSQGHPWSEDEFVVVESKVRTSVMVGAAVLIGLLILALTAYGMMTANEAMLAKILDLAHLGGGVILVWAGGLGLLKVISRIRFDDEE